MKTAVAQVRPAAAPIVQLVDEHAADEAAQLVRARGFAEPLLAGQALDTGEEALAHADGVANILQGIGAAPSMRAAAYLVYAGDYLNKPEEVVAKAFGASNASLVVSTRKLVQIQRAAREAKVGDEQRAQQTERVRKMLLAFSRDLRVVLLRLASRLQTLRYYAASKRPCPELLARESMQVFAPLANRLGIWQIKWELEDLSFRFLQPEQYKAMARLLDEKRVEREQRVEAFRQRLGDTLREHGVHAEVQGRPKHLYSIWKKMQGKGIDFSHVFDVRAVRVIVADVPDCYAVLSRVHELYRVVPGEFDDYIARPKLNGYQSLHNVVLDDDGRAVEVQIRTRAMHEHAEHGVAAHWAYKEAGVKGYAGVAAGADFDAQVAEARKAVLRQLLAWEREFAGGDDAAEEFHLLVGMLPVERTAAAHIVLPRPRLAPERVPDGDLATVADDRIEIDLDQRQERPHRIVPDRHQRAPPGAVELDREMIECGQQQRLLAGEMEGDRPRRHLRRRRHPLHGRARQAEARDGRHRRLEDAFAAARGRNALGPPRQLIHHELRDRGGHDQHAPYVR